MHGGLKITTTTTKIWFLSGKASGITFPLSSGSLLIIPALTHEAKQFYFQLYVRGWGGSKACGDKEFEKAPKSPLKKTIISSFPAFAYHAY